MARNGGLIGRLREEVEQRAGVTIRPAREVAQLEEAAYELEAFREEASDLAYHSLQYFSGRPQEMRPERRERLAQRARVAYMEDPLAGRSVEMTADFAFGKGVSKPTARDPKVQEVIDRAWEDPNNQDKLTSFSAQRKLSNDLKTQANLFITLYEAGPRVRVGRLDNDTVENIVVDPEDRLRPLYYLTRKRRLEWDFAADRMKVLDEIGEGGRPKVMYHAHWRNVDDVNSEREEAREAKLDAPPDDKLGKGVVYHVSVNQLGEQLFGVSPFARSLRFYSGMNRFTESRVTMALASASFIAKRVYRGGQNALVRSATRVLGQTGELGARSGGLRWPRDPTMTDPAREAGMERGFGRWPSRPQGPGVVPPSPASIRQENEGDRLEAMNLRSGAGEAAQDVQVVRAPIAAAEGYGQHYLGDASNANLATATTLELPVLMMIGAWQQVFEDLLRWFVDRAIEAAIRAGELGGMAKSVHDAGRPMAEFRLSETEDVAQFKDRTNIDLSYEFKMPRPGRRDLGEVVDACVAAMAQVDPQGANIPFRRTVLTFLFSEGFELDDPSRAVMEAVPDGAPPTGPAVTGGVGHDGKPTGPAPGTQPPPPAGPGEPADVRSQYGESRTPTTPKEAEKRIQQQSGWLPPELAEEVRAHLHRTRELYGATVAPSVNGHGAG